ncbi:MAG TPA: MerR family transcriptional regulator [Propionibacteriaceae bacterium]|nr:MerR family transcriptional regulator [Propionibacteriaceae bacterium]
MSRASGVSSIGAVADRTGLPVETIRFYETSGLLAPKRDRSGHRRYAEADIHELEVIQALRQAGLSLKDIRDHLHPEDEHAPTRRPHAASLLRILDERGADLARARTLVARWAAGEAAS